VSRNVRQIGFLGCFFLVLLRVAIGWQFLYEGLWKLSTQNTARPWSAEGYLVNARGPFREKFRGMVDDPNGFDKLDYKKVSESWDGWRDRFLAKYGDVEDVEKNLTNLLDGPKEFSQPLDELPPGVDPKNIIKTPKGYHLRYNPKAKRLETNLHLLPAERDELLAMARTQPAPDATKPDQAESPASDGGANEEPNKEGKDDDATADREAAEPVAAKPAAIDPVVKKWQDAVKKLYAKSSKLSLKERLQVLLKEDTDRVGQVNKNQEGTIDYERPGKKQVYEHLVERYEANLKKAREAFQNDHLDNQWREILEKKAELIGPVDALTAEFRASAYDLLKAKDAQKGPVPEPSSRIRDINQRTIWTLIILGGGLMAGCFSRLSALGAAGLLLLFYLPMPPWPGVPEAPGPEHSLFVNKNLIEFIACLALAFIPTGRWIGVDAFIRRFIFRRKTD
jgi:uncharacterized membrane protein YphA (DoxX/SURF4 family)